MNKSTYRFLVVALLAALVLFVMNGNLKMVLESGSDDSQGGIDTDAKELDSNCACPTLSSSSIGFKYNFQS